MTTSDDELQQLLLTLSTQFRERLEKELPELHTLAQQLLTSNDSAVQQLILRDIREQLHKLAGAAGTFGYAELGIQARALELSSVALLNASTVAQLQAHAQALQLFSQQDCVAQISDSSEPSTAPYLNSSDSKVNRRIYILEPDQQLGESLQSTLQNFGYATEHVRTSVALRAAVNRQLPDVLIIDSHLDEENPDGLAFAHELAAQLPLPLPLLVISQQHDFDTRLRAVRVGVAGFFTKPLNFSALESRLDSIFVQQRGKPYRVLIIDDDLELSKRYRLVLDNAGMQVETLSQPQNIDEVMHRFNPEVVLLDVHMPLCSGPELAQIIRFNDAWLRVPIIYLSAETDISNQIKALLKAGDDFISKPISDHALVASILARAQRARLLSNALSRDSLTGLLKHADIKEQVAVEVERSARNGGSACVVMLDLDNFKQVNDRYGHAIGDNVIRALSNLLRQRLRRIDSIGRYGGEEFTVVLPDCNLEQAKNILDEIRQRFAELPFMAHDSSFHVTFSAGIAQGNSQSNANQLIELADQAMYAAKAAGRNQVLCSTSAC
ncbi:MAG: diguanylate cyclase [Pseudomonas sp.]|uniref:diguanylate cyclase n=1 Tax=Pseudomonas sp. TaxID=306 RepID=UPI002733A52B|nr:diguanylate cyclase [Pseudomonas sp.]MDP3845328.1 diguanylate cyclase [Pseudomonas sp.]